jgi:hypothetical protein
VIEMLFRLALRGKNSGGIARALNDAGYRTKPRKRGQSPKPWESGSILTVLHNPRDAGLAASRARSSDMDGTGKAPPATIPVRARCRTLRIAPNRARRRGRNQPDA